MKISLISFVLATFLIFAGYTCFAADTVEEPKAIETTSQALSLIEIYNLTNALPKELIDLRSKIGDQVDAAKISEEIANLKIRVEELEWETTMAITDSNISSYELTSLDQKLIKIQIRSARLNKPITANVLALQSLSEEWQAREDNLEQYIIQIGTPSSLTGSLPPSESLTGIIQEANKLIGERVGLIYLAGKEIGQIQARIYILTDQINDLVRYLNAIGFQKTSPSLLSAKFYSRFNRTLLEQAGENARLSATYLKNYLKKNWVGVLTFLTSIALVVFLTRSSRPLVNKSHSWYLFTENLLATGIFIVSAIFVFVEALSVNMSLPLSLIILLEVLLILSAVFLGRHVFVSAPQYITISFFLSFSLAVVMVLSAMKLPQPLVHLFVLGSSLFCLIYFFSLFVKKKAKYSKRGMIILKLFLFVFPFVIFLTGVAGYEQDAVSIFNRVLSLIAITLIIWLIFRILCSLLELILLNIPVRIIRINAPHIVAELAPVIFLAHAVFWFLLTLSYLSVFPTLGSALTAIVSMEFSLFSHTVTPEEILLVIFTLYAILLTSRGVNAFLIQDVMPRYRVERGVQESITRLVQYGILSIGLLILMKLVGFEFGDIAIIGGALGVGIGFGLKEIVNNFVSGLILLFERPVKVGDIIEVDQEMGEVTALGLRATTVKTFDSAEIVIPNAQLITLPVTNWTLGEKKVRIKVPVGVAYGTDLEAVLKILLSCAEANPIVLTQPPARALFLAFGNSSLDFELRVWISDFTDRRTVLSELNQDIDNEFHLAGIEIPFPQSDLHLRSIDKEAATILQQSSR